jgi:hypothetical protein
MTCPRNLFDQRKRLPERRAASEVVVNGQTGFLTAITIPTWVAFQKFQSLIYKMSTSLSLPFVSNRLSLSS